MKGEPISPLQRKKFFAMVRDISHQVPFNGEMLSETDWRLLVYAAAYGQDLVPNPFDPSKFIVCNKVRTNDLDMPTMADLITQLYAFGNEKGVEWSNPAEIAERAANEEEERRWRRG